jgi:BirA family biotin operon repressor/biotin-[acetyl-CoA-carboxylase] ligase
MYLATEKLYAISEVLNVLLECLQKQLQRIEDQDFKSIFQDYNRQLFRLNTVSVFSKKSGFPFNAMIKGVTKKGLLILENESEQLETFNLKEIKYCF